MPRRREQSFSASITIARGLTVGWASNSSIRPRLNVFTPRYVQTLDRYRPLSPRPKLLMCLPVPTLKRASSRMASFGSAVDPSEPQSRPTARRRPYRQPLPRGRTSRIARRHSTPAMPGNRACWSKSALSRASSRSRLALGLWAARLERDANPGGHAKGGTPRLSCSPGHHRPP